MKKRNFSTTFNQTFTTQSNKLAGRSGTSSCASPTPVNHPRVACEVVETPHVQKKNAGLELARELRESLTRCMPSDALLDFIKIDKPPQSLLCLGIALCALSRVLIIAAGEPLLHDDKKLNKTWEGVRSYIAGLKMRSESSAFSTTPEISSQGVKDLIKNQIKHIYKVYLGGSDMTESGLLSVNSSASRIIKSLVDFMKSAFEKLNSSTVIELEAEIPDEEAKKKSISVIIENGESTRLINYKFQTKNTDSPTKKLITLKNIHERNPAGCAEKESTNYRISSSIVCTPKKGKPDENQLQGENKGWRTCRSESKTSSTKKRPGRNSSTFNREQNAKTADRCDTPVNNFTKAVVKAIPKNEKQSSFKKPNGNQYLHSDIKTNLYYSSIK